jgi:hypothetical protein
VSTDRVFSEPVLREYERRGGVKVNPIYDTEETKSTASIAFGLVGGVPSHRMQTAADKFARAADNADDRRRASRCQATGRLAMNAKLDAL